ncbi:hypothetical protein LOC67_12905 [Stieleria sp. JC731]|uniref:hypothetical protein n=1 Tax=Stieleria sp. JC731 TaxID=2894195 RepID=UPI001E3527A3|nr:hypothetical protein [Stieleria sp. JC731]MCC9601448.1 hypothetical protein [Stieleria sp. JC731]
MIPLKSRKVSRDWEGVCGSLAATLRSVAGQACRDFRCAVVGHEDPECVAEADPNIIFHSVQGLDVPDYSGWKPSDRQRAITKDKNTKIFEGVKLLEGKGISHWFALDADDLLRNDFVGNVLDRNLKYGAILQSGYMLDRASGKICPKRNFYEACGSSCVLSSRVVFSKGKTMDAIPWCRYSHLKIGQFFEKELNVQCEWIYDPLVCYVVGHGDNSSADYRRSAIGRLKRKVLWATLGRKFSGRRMSNFSQVEYPFVPAEMNV